ncbi:uncharacterized protein AMSG_04286 [Thecamonas trahens ATCC 50062]|uniref:LicD/FKTN/FKRP nucleotidyltransferase domain-containing protein n=1 Tax=Thecamonas trahens ATCC 50062 TaxID=461836 RepID=A0A0L0D9S9_THETB|nr:hypothetical protein AMSG_04286 [Thecamonas trahens ATCC 50062]KNC48053.1 hypothetical protein AMSG_04286 [Thecamonas trahens ATCC 50062]|eukprot:XP_013759068.1 hypothetical protein AMSG_04286 [Thecamonas trahens ATCC 50062]
MLKHGRPRNASECLKYAEVAVRRSWRVRVVVYGLALVSAVALVCMVYVSSLNSQSLLLEMAECNERILSAHNITTWLDGGPLLGAIRHGDFLPNDDSGDFDIGMVEDDVPKMFALRETIRARCGWLIHRSETNWWPGVLDTLFHIHRAAFRQFAGKWTPVFLDYKDYEDDGRGNLVDLHFVGSEDAVGFPRDAIFPLWDCPFGHTTFKCPNDAELVLRRTYGDDWCIPSSTHTSELSETQRGVAFHEQAYRDFLNIPPPPPRQLRLAPAITTPCPTREDRLAQGLAAAAAAAASSSSSSSSSLSSSTNP